MNNTVLTLLLVFQVKHLLADYFLQGGPMLKKFDKEPKVWIPALAMHCAVHMVMTLVITAIVTHSILMSLGIAALDFVLHFCMDRVKASPFMLGRWKPLFGTAFKMYVNMAQCRNLDGSKITGHTEEQAEAIRNEGKRALRENTFFWWALGIDQSFHHVTHYVIILLMLG